jgi:hypothetical protein
VSGDDIKIRVLPRSEPKKKASPHVDVSAPGSSRFYRILFFLPAAALILLAAVFQDRQPAQPTTPETPARKIAHRQVDSLTKVELHMQDLAFREAQMKRARQLENLKAGAIRPNESQDDYGVLAEQDRRLGLQFNDHRYTPSVDQLPAERINSRLANRRFVNDYERAERIAFVRNFLRSAYERGYEVQLDQNLVVVGVKKITDVRKVNIDQVLDQLAKQGL